jgi:hypothetical protein
VILASFAWQPYNEPWSFDACGLFFCVQGFEDPKVSRRVRARDALDGFPAGYQSSSLSSSFLAFSRTRVRIWSTSSSASRN